MLLSATALAATLMPAAPSASSPAAARSGQAATVVAPVETVATYLRPEVRLRKLHLVRPDLIQYPLSYDVYC